MDFDSLSTELFKKSEIINQLLHLVINFWLVCSYLVIKLTSVPIEQIKNVKFNELQLEGLYENASFQTFRPFLNNSHAEKRNDLVAISSTIQHNQLTSE